MNRKEFHYVPRAIIQYTQADLGILIRCAASHYDARVRALERPGQGAVLNGMRFVIGEKDSAEYELGQDDIDTMLKALEQPTGMMPSVTDEAERARVFFELRKVFLDLRDEYRRLNEPEKEPKGGNVDAKTRT